MQQRKVEVSRWEIVGAWLGIWTPPVGAEIPPVPWRRIALGVVVLAAVAVVVLVQTGETRRANEAREQRAADQAAAERRAAARHAQRLERRQVSPATIPAVQEAVLAVARERHAGGELEHRAVAVRCAPVPGSSATGRRVVLECAATTTAIVDGEGEAVGRLSYPFRAVLQRPSGDLAICATKPPAGEAAIPDPRELVQLPKPCRA